jgi:hypothetical protein
MSGGMNLWDFMPDDLKELFMQDQVDRSGSARQTLWTAPDGWVVGYTTEAVRGGPEQFRGKFVTLAYKPVGKGARSGRGKAHEWTLVYKRGFTKRRLARARAEALYSQHSKRRT